MPETTLAIITWTLAGFAATEVVLYVLEKARRWLS
jgi:hypothetical protein